MPYGFRHCALAALAGAVANCAAIMLLLGGTKNFTLVPPFFLITFIALALGGRPWARRLALGRRDTIGAGILWGAVAGSLTAALIAIVVAAAVLRMPSAPSLHHLTMFALAAVLGIPFGIVDGAVAGLAFVWIGRRATDKASVTP